MATALARIQADSDGKLMLTWLGESLAEIRDQNDILEGVPLYRGQGSATTLKDILGGMRDAPKIVAKIDGR